MLMLLKVPKIKMNTLTKPNITPERISSGEKIWTQANTALNTRFKEADSKINREGLGHSPSNLVDLASERQKFLVESMDMGETTTYNLTANLITKAILELPAASAAQDLLNHNGSTNRKETVAVVSEFNQDLAGAMTYMPESMIDTFPGQFIKAANNIYGQKLPIPLMKEKEFYQILGGMSREVAFARAANDSKTYLEPDEEPIEAHPANVALDVLGVDITLKQGDTTLNIDTKTAASYEMTMDRLRHKGMISEGDHKMAMDEGYIRLGYGKVGKEYIVDADRLGRINKFKYEEPRRVIELCKQLLDAQRYRSQKKVGKIAVNA